MIDNATPSYPSAPPMPTAQPYSQPMRMPKVDGLAIAALVLGIVWVYWIGSILAIIFGAVALKRISTSNGWRTGQGMAIAGLVLGLIGACTLVWCLVLMAGTSS